MTEYQRERFRKSQAKASRRFMFLYVLACISAVVLTMWIFDDDEPTEDQIEQFHERRDAEISDN